MRRRCLKWEGADVHFYLMSRGLKEEAAKYDCEWVCGTGGKNCRWKYTVEMNQLIELSMEGISGMKWQIINKAQENIRLK